ncbi:hypothetical protein N3K63_05890 [Microbacterium sp. W1N]|uniref:hypothetical protein n=1 Tax=Microbacterium festucae TaxID=2977531 RepID=UPI0021C12BB7|nr:hypothetical protein [Microbacterium festucae]MCT9819819.1 hypothetical protein [Microbacterium festucae]
MTRRRLAPMLALSASALLVCALAGCAPEGTAPTATGTSTSSPRASVSPSASTTATPSPSAAAGAACLIGDWRMDQAGLDRFYADINTILSGADIGYTPQGTASLTIGADGAYAWTPPTNVTADVGGTEIAVTLGGALSGTYTATDDRITADTTSTDGLQVSATLDGAPTDASGIIEQIAASPVADAPYTCEGDTLTLESTISGGTATATLQRG